MGTKFFADRNKQVISISSKYLVESDNVIKEFNYISEVTDYMNENPGGDPIAYRYCTICGEFNEVFLTRSRSDG